LGNDYDFDFVDGAYPWPAARGISEVFGEKQMYYSYFDGSAESVRGTVKALGEYAVANGPFDAVMGFSLGAALAMTLLLYADKVGLPRVPFKCAIILCGTLPCDWASLEKGEVQLLSETGPNAVNIPTIHFWSPQDTDYPGQSPEVVKMCNVTTRLELIHSAGHGLPTQSQPVTELAQAIQDTVAKFEIDP
jgi:dienelactone hydrolase